MAALACAAGSASAQTEDTQPPLKHIHVNLNDKEALRMGAVYFMHECMGCHSISGARFSELARPLGLSDAQIQKTINISGRGIYDEITSTMPAATAKKLLHVERPDLTVIANLYDADWLYTYLKSFYLDPSRPTGVNNVVVPNVAMPDVFADLQGLQKPVEAMGYRFGQHTKVAVGVEAAAHGSMTPAQFDQMTRDLVSFLYYVANPHEQQSHAIGIWVLALLAALTALAYLLYRAFWRDVVRPLGARWWSYWKP
jgi:ubiquinol-cytochrome c reductase cytochrome c1 subunit